MVPYMLSHLHKLSKQYPCREKQIQQLSCLLSQHFPSPSALVVHGLEATCKTTIVKGVLALSGLRHAIINCRECITGRHLLEKTTSACIDAVEAATGTQIDRSYYTRTEHLSALTVHLQRLLSSAEAADGGQKEKFVLVFDGIDEQREAPHTLLPALARLGEIIPNLALLFILRFTSQRMLHTAGTPHIHFPSYTRLEAITILSLSPLPIYPPTSLPINYTAASHAADTAWLYPRFLAAIWDSIAKNTARDVVSFRELAERLWGPFTESVREGTHGARELSRILVARRGLLQGEGVGAVGVGVVEVSGKEGVVRAPHDLPYYTKYLLCAAHLASYNPPRTDQLFFSRLGSTKKAAKRRRIAKPGTTTAASASASTNTNASLTTTSSSRRSIPRRLLTPSPFPLERLLAIFHAILPHKAPTTADVYMQVATLTSLRLLVRSGVGGGGGGGATGAGGGGGDVLEAGAARWRVNVSWEWAVTVGRSVGFEMEEFVGE